MTRTFIVDIGLFEPRCGDRLNWTQGFFFDMLEILARENRRVLKCGQIPPLYKSGVRWKAEPPEEERFMTIPAILRDGFADCEDLTAWRVAELRAFGGPDGRGEPAAFYLRRWDVPDKKAPEGLRHQYHVLVLRQRLTQGGWVPWTIEDPSAALGMPTTSEERRLQKASGGF